jgi:hypothetical protein
MKIAALTKHIRARCQCTTYNGNRPLYDGDMQFFDVYRGVTLFLQVLLQTRLHGLDLLSQQIQSANLRAGHLLARQSVYTSELISMPLATRSRMPSYA